MRDPLILAIDQGTSATKCVLVDAAGRIVARGSAPLGEAHPQPGWVEQDAEEIWASVRTAVARCLDGTDAARVAAVGISSQRESLVLWERDSGAPLGPLLSWQDQRTAAQIDAVRSAQTEALVRARSGLPLDPMFSAAKARWLLDAYDPDRRRALAGELCLGTVDSWLLSRFGGEHVIEAGNAARTQLLNVAEIAWDDDLLALFGVPRAALPRVVASTGPFPSVHDLKPLSDGVPVLAVMGDSHAALYAHGAREPGQVKATYGTGSSVMGLLAGPEDLDPGMCLTIAWQTDRPRFAAEGNIRSSGSALRWLATLFGRTPEDLAALGAAAPPTPIVLVPGFTGLGAPYWDRDAVGLLANLRLDTALPELARAALDAMVQQVADVVAALERTTGPIPALYADGGPSRSDALMQMQADALGRPVLRAHDAELSALGVAHMAGLGAGVWTEATLAALPRARDSFVPSQSDSTRATERARWQRAVARARSQQQAIG
jgi:glycerol kinase